MCLFNKCSSTENERAEVQDYALIATMAPNETENPIDDKVAMMIDQIKAEAYAEVERKLANENQTDNATEPTDVIKVTAKELADAVEKNVTEAQNLYVGKWLEVTGKVGTVVHETVRTFKQTYNGKTTTFTTGEHQYEIAGTKIKSGFIYWLVEEKRYVSPEVVVEMDMSLCEAWMPQNSTATVVGKCVAIDEDDIVLVSGRHPS